ncbi:MAG TPA: NUDIX domain-containing protein [Anaerolineaceae bacterium]|nr:NUDIX domain-containing protein [Anaerolineaceae bacterium]
MLPPITFTLCFLTRPGEILLLLRNNPPNRGLWNGVGGHIEPGEAPLAACLREVAEETGYQLAGARYAGLLTWEGFETPPGGLHLFVAPAPAGEPRPCDEGRLAWHPAAWACQSAEVVSNLHVVLPHILGGGPAQHYHFRYRASEIDGYELRPLPANH